MASSSHRKKKSKEQSNSSQGILENWFAGDSEAMTRFIHETSRKQVNVPKVLEFSWLREENLTEVKTLLDGDQAQEDMEANQQDQEEVEAQMEDAHGGQSPPQRITRSMFKALGVRGHLFSLFVISLVEGA